MEKYVYGVDIGGTNIKIGLYRVAPIKKVEITTIKTPVNNQEEAIFLSIAETIEKLNQANEISFEDVVGVGITVPCPVINCTTGLCPNIDLDNIDIVKTAKKYLSKNVHIEVANDANMAAYGEYKYLGGKIKNAAFYTLGTGVGGGLIINGKIIEGIHGTGGEFGHMKVFDGKGVYCGCGGEGCLEQYAGTVGLKRIAKQYTTFQNSIIDKEDLTAKEIFDAAKMGDKVAIDVVDKAMEALAISASILAVTVDPEVFIIGGGIASAGNFLIDRLTKAYKEKARFNTGDTPFVIAKLKNNAGIYGAANYVYERYLEIDS